MDRLVTLGCQEGGAAPDSTGRGQWMLCTWDFSWTLFFPWLIFFLGATRLVGSRFPQAEIAAKVPSPDHWAARGAARGTARGTARGLLDYCLFL